MIIKSIEIYRLSIRIVPFSIATGTMRHAQNVFIRVHTDNGLYGVGECSAFPTIVGETQETCLVMARDFARIWKGKDASDITGRLNDLNQYCSDNTTIKSAFDMALHDLGAKNAETPLYLFLGGSARPIQTDITIGIGTVEEMTATAIAYAKQGACEIKVKLGKNVEEDIRRISSIRQAIGSTIKIRLDANQGWSFDDTVKALTAMEPMDIEFCEQPMGSWNDHLLPALMAAVSIKIMADESCYDAHDAERLIRTQSCDYINIKLAKSGGIHEAMKIHDVAYRNGIPCMIGGMLESRLALTANLHLVYASAGITFYDMDSPLLGLLEDPVVGGVRYQNYQLHIVDQPGIGADIDERFLQQCEKWVV
ncbi:mandelate racemase/muconate lactonizing enzyme family protein [Parapedobacter tibetensis]|uniref:mandelate racemase/muconate lactonizing enzyme family protein n=1 Tax=Parapedobacter tibetensis TaxID=2972951 RepID=UPI00214D32A0|nr:dipeptide epimerase [Parapedobacter tibetensis]